MGTEQFVTGIVSVSDLWCGYTPKYGSLAVRSDPGEALTITLTPTLT